MRLYVLTLFVVFMMTAQPVQAAQVPAAASWSLTAVGDIMLDRHVREQMKVKGNMYPFAKIAPQLKGAEVVLGNLEGPITANRSVATNNHLVFTFEPTVAPILKRVGLTTLSLANNHTLNFGQSGLISTRAALKKSGLEYFGDPKNRTGYHLTKTINHQQVVFLGYHGLVGGLDTVLLDVQRAHQKGEYVMVMAHSGVEYSLMFTARQQQDYRRLIDAGADLIIGAHPHVVEPLEVYHGKLIAYSLGNFIFDQYFSADTQQGLLLNMIFSSSTMTINIIPLLASNGQVAAAVGTVKTKLLERLAKSSVVTSAVRDNIRAGSFIISR